MLHCPNPTPRPLDFLDQVHAALRRRSMSRKEGCDIRTIQRLLGHRDLRSTMIYAHMLLEQKGGLLSPLDRLLAR